MKKKDSQQEKISQEPSEQQNEHMNSTKGQVPGNEQEKVEALSKEEVLEKEIAELKSQLGETKDKYLRLFAEFDNYKKRASRERMEWIKTAGQETIISLLPVLDDFERGLKQLENTQEVQSIKDGITLISNKLRTILEQKGLKVMESIGKEFNTEFHDAISEVQAPSEETKGRVVDEIEKGYYLNDVIIRHAKVVVGK